MLITALLAELLGTFFFFSIILTQENAIAIGIALAAAIFFGSFLSGAHYNPAVTIMMFAKGELSKLHTIMYIIIQIIGGLLALAYWKLKTLYPFTPLTPFD